MFNATAVGDPQPGEIPGPCHDIGETRVSVTPCWSTEAHFNPEGEAENFVRILQARLPGTTSFFTLSSTLCAPSSNEVCDLTRTWKPPMSAKRTVARRDGKGCGHFRESDSCVTADPEVLLLAGDPRHGNPCCSDMKPVTAKTRQRPDGSSPGRTARPRPRIPHTESRRIPQSHEEAIAAASAYPWGVRVRGGGRLRPRTAPRPPHPGFPTRRHRDRAPFARDAK